MRRHQWELLRVAYLLAGDRERAGTLAASTLLSALANPPADDADPRQHLLLDLATRFVEHPSRSTWLERPGEVAYVVEDEPYRVKTALDRLEARERAALVLSRFCGLPGHVLHASSLHAERGDLHDALARSSERVALAAGRSGDAVIVDLLNRLLIEAPSTDLWPEIERDVRGAWAANQRRQRLLTVAVVAGVALLLGGAVVWLAGLRIGGDEGASGVARNSATATPAPAGPSPTPEARAAFAAVATPDVEPADVVVVPDLQFLRMIEQAGESQSALTVYDPVANQTSALIDAGGLPLVSPDGQWILASRGLPDKPGMSLLAAASLLEAGVTWEVQLSTPRALAVGDTHVYALVRLDSDSYWIQKIDLATGESEGALELAGDEVTPSSVRAARLVFLPTADGGRLALLAERFDQSRQQHSRTLTIYRPYNGAVIDSFAQDMDLRDFSVGSARLMAGENTLYSVVPDASGYQLRLQFLDLDTGTLQSLALPLAARSSALEDGRGENEVHLVPSNTGAMLYVIQTRQRQVAVVNMRTRGVAGVFPLTSGSYEQADLESTLNRVSYMEAVLSPDGTRLYMANNREKNQSINGYPSQSPVWVFDTSTWQVVDRWTVGGLPRTMTMSGDGSRVYLHSARSDGEVHLTVFDVATGEALDVWREIPGPEWADVQRISALHQLFHAQYGFRPAVGEVAPRDNSLVAVLPGVVVEAEGAVAGADTVVTARVVHPLTGVAASGDPALRFDPRATLAIELSSSTGGHQAILVPSSVEPGVYQGRARLDGAGSWNARVTVINRDGTTWTVRQQSAIDVAEGLVASDGSAYRFRIDPANPVNRRTITLRVWMVEAQEGGRLQEDIQFLDSIVGTPLLVLSHPDGERHEVTLEPLDHASYLGWVRLAEPGVWTARMTLELASGELLAINAGVLEIHDLTAPYRPSNPGGGAASSNSSNSSNAANVGARIGNPAGR